MKLRVIKVGDLFVDPHVQLEFGLSEAKWRKMAARFLPSGLVALQVVPQTSNGATRYSIIDGRHRFLAATAVGYTEFRCDVHDEIDYDDLGAKAALKRLFDDSRHVGALERFLIRVMARDPEAVAVNEIARDAGYEIAHHNGKGRDGDLLVLECVVTLERIYKTLGAEGLARTLALDSQWLIHPTAAKQAWVNVCGLLVRDGYDLAMTDAHRDKLRAMSPDEILALARGEIVREGVSIPHDASGAFSAVSYKAAGIIRRRLRLRQRDPVKTTPRSSQARAI